MICALSIKATASLHNESVEETRDSIRELRTELQSQRARLQEQTELVATLMAAYAAEKEATRKQMEQFEGKLQSQHIMIEKLLQLAGR